MFRFDAPVLLRRRERAARYIQRPHLLAKPAPRQAGALHSVEGVTTDARRTGLPAPRSGLDYPCAPPHRRRTPWSRS
jgi:hypothetical protein